MYKYLDDCEPVSLKELDIRQFIMLQESDNPLVKIRFFLDTAYLKRDFILDLVIWNLSEDNLEQTKKIVYYVLNNFGKLFETGWTALYYYLCGVDSNVKEHTMQEFFVEQVDFENPYYTIQLEMNCDHLEDGQARYCFVVATACDYRKWMIADDNMRVYMTGNKACGFNDDNDDCQMMGDLKECGMFYEMGSQLAEG
ncbi:MAG: hypothetical protein J6D08_08560 [Lachnospiraceae bacterium]|nr:hypothetical protein [Lachnospiraceae bacterium]